MAWRMAMPRSSRCQPAVLFNGDLFRLNMSLPLTIVPGVFLWREKFSALEQQQLLDAVRERLKQAPLYKPVMPGNGKAFLGGGE